ncbi:hypothetical protein SETIT_9G066400v2 [Setaria italica]|uniref:Neprosin activation peptide domain-containing protein n=2 Tax=Setaria TaxID=4554 RepID=A0A368SDZ6_SETIT|nr:hypothetical protein SETIT_9G066400v2 [Setaria italica]TKV91000.1 hypothetical protein SEVIR_9G065700v2 [Setaria viridis]
MANLAVLVTVFLVAEAIMLPAVHGARPLESVELVASSVAKPPSSTSLQVPALVPLDGHFEEEADGPAAAGYLVTDCTHKTPVNGP